MEVSMLFCKKINLYSKVGAMGDSCGYGSLQEVVG
jgi:hypothetical protein